jgi:hypothetical protein
MKSKATYLLIAILVILAGVHLSKVDKAPLMQAKPSQPPFKLSDKFDGQWRGERLDVSGDAICLESAITGEIVGGEVKLNLVYNNTTLTGWISEQGVLVLYSGSQRWGYRFSGQAQEERIEGKWRVTNAACNGSWFVERA